MLQQLDQQKSDREQRFRVLSGLVQDIGEDMYQRGDGRRMNEKISQLEVKQNEIEEDLVWQDRR